MKNYIIILLLVCILVISSYYFRLNKIIILNKFPANDLNPIEGVDSPLFLFLFFSSKNCLPCLEIIEVLNNLPKNYQVIGIVPENDLLYESELRDLTGAQFALRSFKNYEKYAPRYAPSLVGVSRSKKILFVLPGVPKEKEYLEGFLHELSRKAYPILIE